MNLFGAAKKNDQGYTFRKMKPRDVDAALDIIEDHDEDDAAEAAHTFSGDLSGYFVVEANGFVVGCTGYSRITDAPTSAWLAWTYVDDEMRGQGVASFMMEELRFVLMKTKVERLFISTGDWKEGDVDIYAEARRFYERLGAVRELVIEDYYSKGEATYIYRLPLETSAFMPPSVEPGGGISFRGLDVLPESDTGYVLLWDEMMEEGDRDAEDQALTELIEEARGEGAHAIFASIPSSLAASAASRLETAGFRKLGDVSDYYGAGESDCYWGLYF